MLGFVDLLLLGLRGAQIASNSLQNIFSMVSQTAGIHGWHRRVHRPGERFPSLQNRLHIFVDEI